MDKFKAIQQEIEHLIEKLKIELKTQSLNAQSQIKPPNQLFWPKVKNFLGKIWAGNDWKENSLTLENYAYLSDQSLALATLILEDLNLSAIDGVLDGFKSNLNSILFKYFRKQQTEDEEASARDYLNKLNIPDNLKNKDTINTWDVSNVNTAPINPTPVAAPVSPSISKKSTKKSNKTKPIANKKPKKGNKLEPKNKKPRKVNAPPIAATPVNGPMNITMPDNIDPHDETLGGLF